MYIFKSPTVKLEPENVGDRFYSVSEMWMEITFQEITKGFSYLYKELSYLYCSYTIVPTL